MVRSGPLPPQLQRRGAALLCAAALAALPARLAAQTDYYNTDAGRPVLIEDAYPTERYAFELQLAPLRLERVSGGVYDWGVEPEIAYGILPQTHVEVGFPLAWTDAAGAAGEFGLAGIDVSVLHNLNVETSGLPAFGIAAEAVLPVGSLAPDQLYPSVKAIATRTFGFARFHVNGRYTFGSEPDSDTAGEAAEGPEELSRWMAGVAVDRTLPLRSMLLIADVYAAQPLHEEEDLEWNAGAGVRFQWSPRLAVDAGLGRRLTGGPRWFVTFGTAYAFAVRSLIPLPAR
ncbi:MAG TPA: transporter [Longimicrobiaceae bacterium]|nr:transporter [Longimicrobiaceae bacterium]